MASLKSGFMSFLISGFGTRMAALQAVGIVLAVCLFGFWLAYKIIKMIYEAIRGPQVPNFKEGNYKVVLTSVGNDPKCLRKQLLEFKGFTKGWVNRLIEGKENVIARGLRAQDAEDFKVVIEDFGATAEVQMDTK